MATNEQRGRLTIATAKPQATAHVVLITGVPLSNYDRNTFCTFDARGYTDYPVYSELAA